MAQAIRCLTVLRKETELSSDLLVNMAGLTPRHGSKNCHLRFGNRKPFGLKFKRTANRQKFNLQLRKVLDYVVAESVLVFHRTRLYHRAKMPGGRIGSGLFEMGIVIVLVLLGLIPAAVAQSKGHSFFVWWVYGAALFIVALPHALMMKADTQAIEASRLESGDSRKCPFCAEIIKRPSRSRKGTVFSYGGSMARPCSSWHCPMPR